MYTAESARLKEFDACTKAVHNWSDEILNSFDCVYTTTSDHNGFVIKCRHFYFLLYLKQPIIYSKISRICF
ncbi:MAG: hypothetical protein IJB09_10350 [Oscillospiraceae bacterium]|nr:hypothetical protein [Oscillospiraceae bacterium]